MHSSESGGEAPLFVLATRLYVHFKFKTRKSFNPQAALIDDDYAREVLAQARAVKDAKLHELARLFEEVRFGDGKAVAPTPAAAKSREKDNVGPTLDLSLDTPG